MSDVADGTAPAEAIQVSPAVLTICRALAEAGHEAWAVGGAIRDALLGRPIGDWDVATSAHPDEVAALFPHTVPTGVEHGTVTVVVGRGKGHEAIEVTTFRGEGAYSDARRPDEVRFGVPLDEDLARRDFTINAIAFDPLAKVIRDPFGGRRDLGRRLVRAVGDPEERFREDGLRVMRAVRFVAQLDCAVDPATEDAIPRALDSLAKVARERVRVELFRLLVGCAAPRALDLSRRCGVIDVAAPEVAARYPASEPHTWRAALTRLSHAPASAPLRLVALLANDAPALPAEWETLAPSRRIAVLEDHNAAKDAEALLRGLRASNADRKRACQLVGLAAAPRAADLEAPLLRRLAGRIGRDRAADLAALWRADHLASGDEKLAPAAERLEGILTRKEPVCARDLAVSGGELMRALGLSPGPQVGELVDDLVEEVCDDPSRNERDALLARARARLESG